MSKPERDYSGPIEVVSVEPGKIVLRHEVTPPISTNPTKHTYECITSTGDTHRFDAPDRDAARYHFKTVLGLDVTQFHAGDTCQEEFENTLSEDEDEYPWIPNLGHKPVPDDVRVDLLWKSGGSDQGKKTCQWLWRASDELHSITHWSITHWRPTDPGQWIENTGKCPGLQSW